jgi:uncharacterized membrane-anchored protein
MGQVRQWALGGAAALLLLGAGTAGLAPGSAWAQDPASNAAPADQTNAIAQRDALIKKIDALPWQTGPGTATVASNATIALPNGARFLAPPDSSTFMQIQENPPSDGEYIYSNGDTSWFSVFSFEPSGYVKDTDQIDPDALLKTLKDQNVQDTAQRQKMGLGTLTLQGWYVPPHYDKSTQTLEWGTRLIDQNNQPVVNYTVRLLGRTGVMSATLVSDPEHFDSDLKDFKTALGTFHYNAGQTYAEFKQGDKVAEYGLGALVVGGAAAVAVKAGLPFLKFIWVGIVAGGASIMAFFRRIFGKKKTA